MTPINELDDKYLVLKWDDIGKLKAIDKTNLNTIIGRIGVVRRKKEEHKYVVLNLDDDIDLEYLLHYIRYNTCDRPMGRYARFCVKDIALGLVNAILNVKDKNVTEDAQNHPNPV
jgi:hypothetical protein